MPWGATDRPVLEKQFLPSDLVHARGRLAIRRVYIGTCTVCMEARLFYLDRNYFAVWDCTISL